MSMEVESQKIIYTKKAKNVPIHFINHMIIPSGHMT